MSDFLTGNDSQEAYIDLIRQAKNDFNGFNLLVGDTEKITYYNNIQDEVSSIERGTHSLSNKFLNTPWPKVKLGRTLLNDYVNQNAVMNPDDLFTILSNTQIAPDEALPKTGISLHLERQVSPIFINVDEYGTRSSTVLLITKDNEVSFIERTYNKGKFINEEAFAFNIKSGT